VSIVQARTRNEKLIERSMYTIAEHAKDKSISHPRAGEGET
jgi:hypothetical protein